MSILISGILKDASGGILPNIPILFKSLKTNLNILTGIDTTIRTNVNGGYSVDITPGSYSVYINIGGHGQYKVGDIQVYSDSEPGTLESFLTIPGVSGITPEILAQVVQARLDAINAANNAASDATTIINSQLQSQREEFDAFLLSSGYEYLGDYAQGPFQFERRNQYIRYNNQYYRLNNSTPTGFTTSGTDDASFLLDVSHFLLMDGDTIRQSLGSVYGFGMLGQSLYSDIRSYTGDHVSLMCCGGNARLDGAQGIFDQVPGGAVMTIPDDDCVHIRDTLGRLWKRRFEGDEIHMAWARAKSLKQTTAPQDLAFKNCLKAASSISESGYPQSIIRALDNATTYLAEKHYIRCGNFPEYMAWKLPPNGGGSRFGLRGKWAQGIEAGWFIVQANNPVFDFIIDNTGVDFNLDSYTFEQLQDIVENSYILRLESMVNAPEFNIHAGNYPGTVLYSLGKSDYSAVTAHWPDLTATLPSIQNVGKAAFNVKHCGRAFLLKNCGAGMGHFHSMWVQDTAIPSWMYSCYDVTMLFEDYVPHTEERGGLIFEACGTLSLNNILTGAGGVGHLCIWDCRNVTIDKHISICGAPTYAESNPNLYAGEICNSEVAIYGVHAQGSGKFMRVGFNSRLTFYHLTAWDVAQLIFGTNDLNLLKYRGQRAAVLNDPIKVFLESGFVQSANTADKGWPCQPLIVYDETIGSDFQLLFNLEANNNHSGYDTQPEALLALIDIRSTSPTGEVALGPESKLEGNTSNYVVRLANKNQLKDVLTRKTNFVRIRYTDDGSQSSFSLRHASHPLQGTVVGRNAAYSYPYRRPGLYSVKITIPSTGGSFSVTHNGLTICEQDQVGFHRVLVDLRFQETIQITINGGEAVTMTNAEWRYCVG